MCHILLLLPIVALPVFVLLPWQEALLVYIGVTALSGVLYLLMWRDVRRPPSTGIEGMMGGIGTVFQLDRGKAKVFYHGEIWDAVSKEAITPGEEVEIVGFDEMKLFVRRKI